MGMAMVLKGKLFLVALVICFLLGQALPGPIEVNELRGAAKERASSRPTEEELQSFQKRLGYKFKDEQLLLLALTHPSYSEYNNLRLHFLGSHVLSLAAASQVYSAMPEISYSDMDYQMKLLVNETHCSAVAKRLKLDDVIMVSKAASQVTKKMRVAAYKAVLGAVHVDGTFEDAMRICEDSGPRTLFSLADQ